MKKHTPHNRLMELRTIRTGSWHIQYCRVPNLLAVLSSDTGNKDSLLQRAVYVLVPESILLYYLLFMFDRDMYKSSSSGIYN